MSAERPRPAAVIAQHLELTAPARALLQEGLMAEPFLALLDAGQLYPDALRVVPHTLAKREAIWWGCLCIWQVDRPEPPPADRAALGAAIAWVQEPTEATRRAAESAGKAAAYSPAGGLAQAVFFSGGSIAPPGGPDVLPEPHIAGKMISSAVLMASQRVPPREVPACQRQFLTLARDVAEGRSRWNQASS